MYLENRKHICIVGGSGFVGRHLTRRLVRGGHQVTVLSRHRERHREAIALGDVAVIEGDPLDRRFLAASIEGADAVVNLVGILNETGREGGGFQSAHVDLVRALLDACRETGAMRYLHMSALNADPEGPSEYLRTKGQAEQLVRQAGAEGMQVTCFRPSVLFGPDDGFTNRFAGLLKRIPAVFPLACAGARFQPVYVEDVVTVMTASLADKHTFGRNYNLCGPKVYSLRQIVEYIDELLGKSHSVLALSDKMSQRQARLMDHVPGKPFSTDNYRSLQVDSVCDAGFPREFGITPKSMEEILPAYLGAKSEKQRYVEFRRQARR